MLSKLWNVLKNVDGKLEDCFVYCDKQYDFLLQKMKAEKSIAYTVLFVVFMLVFIF